ncbi:hypothetical protein ATANTOWER_011222 [Ataeniobius toweri]|uniref:Uncharacterized protein n=1 Tax=Ataeniobius toweri TaxID=208326 RepID=A0ABU7A5M9_9TELE|nr:hypothetical protein [Ataeniobius toweri]
MHTATRINTTFERAEVDLGSFHTPVPYLPSGVGGRERERAFWSGSGLGLVFGSWGLSGAGTAFQPPRDCLDFFGSHSLASVPSLSGGWEPGSGGACLVRWGVPCGCVGGRHAGAAIKMFHP